MSKIKTISQRAKAYVIRVDADPNGDAARDYKAGYRRALKDVIKVIYDSPNDDDYETVHAVETFIRDVGAASLVGEFDE